MPASWKKAILGFLIESRNTLAMIAIIGGAQTLFSLLLWQVLFRKYPLGFSMGLTLVGFASWFLSFLMGFGSRRFTSGSPRSLFPAGMLAQPKTSNRSDPQSDRGGCGCLLFAASLIPLAIAFVIRTQADLSTGKTWQDIFPPPMP